MRLRRRTPQSREWNGAPREVLSLWRLSEPGVGAGGDRVALATAPRCDSYWSRLGAVTRAWGSRTAGGSPAMKMIGHETESIHKRYTIVDNAMLREGPAKLDVRSAEQKAKTAAERRGQLRRFKKQSA